MPPIEEKAQAYAENVRGSLGLNPYNEIESAYLQGANDILSLPLCERLTEEEKVKIRALYCLTNCDCGYAPVTIGALKQIFGSDFFKEGGNDGR